jgi:hypothetical protein
LTPEPVVAWLHGVDAPRITQDQLDDLARKLTPGFRGLDPHDPATIAAVENTVKRVQDVHNGLDDHARSAPPPFPGKPWPRVRQITEEDARQLKNAILAGLP